MSDRKITFKIVTPEKLVYENEVDQITLPTKDGVITVLPGHEGLVSLVESGEVLVKVDGNGIVLHVHKGVLEVKPGSRVTVLADSADHVNELDEEKILEAKARVEKILEDKDKLSEVEFARFEDSLAREIARLSILRKYK